MRSRFPHGGEVLGAAPANPILAPVLSQDRALSMSRQRDLLDLQAIQRIPGLAGYWKNDPQYMFEDSAGTTPASTSGTGPIGQWRAVSSTRSVGSEQAGTIPAPTIFNSAGTVGTWDSGTNTMANTGATTSGYPRFAFNLGIVVGSTYLVTGMVSGNLGRLAYIRLVNTGTANNVPYDVATGIFSGEVTAATATFEMVTSLVAGESLTISSLSIKPVTGNHAIQWTTANKPILRKTPTTGVYWLDANTSTSALNVALGNLGSACTVARSGAEGVTFTENVSITSTYNIAPAFSFNSDVAIFNRALTETEKALITRYMARAVPLLGSNLITNGTFDTDTAWTKGTGWSIGSGIASKSAGTASNLTQSVGVSGNAYYAKADATVTAGTIGAYPGSGTTQFGSTSATGTLAHVMKASGTGIGVRGDASFAGNVDNATIKEIL